MTFDTKTIAVQGGSLPVQLRNGDPEVPTLIFLHYWGGSHRTWGPVIGELNWIGPVATYDHRGWGQSRGLPGPYGIDQLTDDLERIVTELGARHYVLVGHSMGGKVVQLFAARRPAGLTGVVLIAPAPAHPTISEPEQQGLSHAYDSENTITEALTHVLTHHPLPHDLHTQVITDSLAADPPARSAWPLHSIAQDITATVPSIEVPVLILAGEYDQVDSPATLLEHLLPYLPTAEFEILPGTGHLSPLEIPAALATRLRKFLGE
ncbi:MAG: alpha/beta hydrolase [Nocardia sp.]|uniref:alpha/beta fold hydrolase n=1 Tax=Nocardia sp. TaxID=1821 RepID=UPI00262EBC8F|nr:alpha/beta hydrolase [Nocardia sp.]MCU1645679.1 alpha/beta hydrolase [Nocardia sp.]